MHAARCSAALALVVCAAPVVAHGQTIAEWAAAGSSGAYHSDASWSVGGQPPGAPGSVPDTVTETARFALTSSFTVRLTPGSDTSVADIEVLPGARVRLNLDTTNPAIGNASLTASGGLLLDGGTIDVEDAAGDSIHLGADLLDVFGGGTFTLEDGASITAAHTTLDQGVPGTPSSLRLWSNANHSIGEVSIGETGAAGFEGELSLANGSMVNTANVSVGAGGADRNGTVSIFDATLEQAGAATLTIGSDAATGSATVFVGAAGLLGTGTGGVTIDPTGRLTNSGGHIDFNGDLLITGGQYRDNFNNSTRAFAPGSRIEVSGGGQLTLGDQTLSLLDAQSLVLAVDGIVNGNGGIELGSESTLEVEFATSGALGSPSLQFEGDADLAGAILISINDSSTPSLGDAFPLLSANSITNNALSVSGPALPSGLDWELQTLSGELRAVVVEAPALDGDYNGDGQVTAADFTTVRDTAGTLAPIGDFVEWRQQFGVTTVTVSSAAAPVPEPASLSLLVVMTVTGWRFRRAGAA